MSPACLVSICSARCRQRSTPSSSSLSSHGTNAENVGLFYVRNSNGEMVPLSTVTNVQSRAGPEFTMRFNLYRAAQINATASPGFSSRDAMNALEQTFAQTMPTEMGYDYSA